MLPNGELLAIGLNARQDTQVATALVSRDEGISWSAPRDLFVLPKTEGRFGYYRVLADRAGEVHLFFLCVPPVSSGKSAKESLDIWHTRSRRNATAWDPPTRIWKGRAGDLLSATQLSGGRILLPISYMTDRTWSRRGQDFAAFTYLGKFESSLLYSDDDGATWRQSPSVLRVQTPDLGTLGAVEPAVLELRDGRVWMLIRTERGRFFESFSSDGGATWSAAQPSPIASSDSPAGLLRLPDGRILLLVNNCERFPYAYGGRHVLHGAISADEGRTWHGYREVVRDPLRNAPPPPSGDFGASYPFPVLTKTGKVIFSLGVESGTRSQHPEDGSRPGAQKRALVLLDPGWLDQRSAETDFSANLDAWSIFGTKGVTIGSSPQTGQSKVLSLSKPEAAWPSGAVWNFPAGPKGTLRIRVMLRPGFRGALLGLTDHFSVPWDDEDQFFNVFQVELRSLESQLSPDRWHNLEFDWKEHECRLRIDGRDVTTLAPQRRPQNQGICYLRIRSTAPLTDPAGLLLEHAAANVVPARP